MKPLVQKLPLTESNSFVAKTFRSPHFEVAWHQHIEYELILFTEGAGMTFVGNYIGEFETGDIYFLGSNLPHTFQKNGDQETSAVVVQFRDDFWGRDFIHIPENQLIRKLLESSIQGLKITGESKSLLQPLIKELEWANNSKRILILLECLHIMAERKEYTTLSMQEIVEINHKDKECIDAIFQFTINSFKEPVSLSKVASIACMSVPAFCRYFKRRTQKTYIDFLNQVRIGYACFLLQDTQKTIHDICYECGFNTISNFHKQFLKIKYQTPLQFRKNFASKYYLQGQQHC
jgi:AraC-like DNA-binding protein/quercetin dioxygenase-like cupin family protein